MAFLLNLPYCLYRKKLLLRIALYPCNSVLPDNYVAAGHVFYHAYHAALLSNNPWDLVGCNFYNPSAPQLPQARAFHAYVHKLLRSNIVDFCNNVIAHAVILRKIGTSRYEFRGSLPHRQHCRVWAVRVNSPPVHADISHLADYRVVLLWDIPPGHRNELYRPPVQ